LVLASDGAFYGTTLTAVRRIRDSGFGITPAGQLTTPASFGLDNGTLPRGRLVESTAGTFLWNRLKRQRQNYGTIFRFTTNGV